MDFSVNWMSSNQGFFMGILENKQFKTFTMKNMMNEVFGEVNNFYNCLG